MSARIPLRQSSLRQISGLLLDGVPVELPTYERRLEQRICHIGVGGFHRAHQAHYLHRLLQQGLGEGWGICGIALRSADRPLHQSLHDQDWLYSLWEVDAHGRRVSVIGSLMSYLDASEDGLAAVDVMSDAATRIVSLTITEAGYCLGPDHQLDLQHPGIARDLEYPDDPRSAQGLIVMALGRRRAAGRPGFTLMSCDNLIENGHRLRSSILGFARRIDGSLADWIEQFVSFPCSMVDRITPVADAHRNETLCQSWGVQDRALVLCEPWQQWILEDGFVAGRPAFEKVGVVLSERVKAFENMKVGLLNGGHSAISHLGLLKGFVRVHEALAQPAMARWLGHYMDEIAATLEPIPGVRFAEYQQSLIDRFGNPAIEDQLQRLAQDTSSKFQQVLLPPLLKCLQQGQDFEHIAAALALWTLYLASLEGNAAARSAYQDARKDLLIAEATAAASSGTTDTFLMATFLLPAESRRRVVERVDHHLQHLQGSDLFTHLDSIQAQP